MCICHAESFEPAPGIVDGFGGESLVQVRARRKDLFAARKDNAADRVLVLQVRQGRIELGQELHVERVLFLGPIETDNSDRGAFFDSEKFGHFGFYPKQAKPPFTLSVCPVICRATSEHR